jgi:hypothetical protein
MYPYLVVKVCIEFIFIRKPFRENDRLMHCPAVPLRFKINAKKRPPRLPNGDGRIFELILFCWFHN